MGNDLADILEREPRGLGNFRRRVAEKVAVQMDVEQIHQTRDFVGQLRSGKSRLINSQTRPLHASEENETRRQGSDNP